MEPKVLEMCAPIQASHAWLFVIHMGLLAYQAPPVPWNVQNKTGGLPFLLWGSSH